MVLGVGLKLCLVFDNQNRSPDVLLAFWKSQKGKLNVSRFPHAPHTNEHPPHTFPLLVPIYAINISRKREGVKKYAYQKRFFQKKALGV